MTPDRNITSLIRENKSLFIIIVVGLFIIQLEIFAVAVIKSGRKAWLEISDQQGQVVYISQETNMSRFNRLAFERNFGPLENYQVRLVTKEIPFPFRAWFVAAVGIPIGAMLLLAFVVKAWVAIFFGHATARSDTQDADADVRPLERLLRRTTGLNIFMIGFFALLAVLAYWIVPNLILYVGQVGIEIIIRYKWFFAFVILTLVGLLIWVIYLRYLLARRAIDSRTEVEKLRLQLEITHDHSPARQMTHHAGQVPPQITMEAPGASDVKDRSDKD